MRRKQQTGGDNRRQEKQFLIRNDGVTACIKQGTVRAAADGRTGLGQLQCFSMDIKTGGKSRKPGIIPVFLFQAAGIKEIIWKKRLQWKNC